MGQIVAPASEVMQYTCLAAPAPWDIMPELYWLKMKK